MFARVARSRYFMCLSITVFYLRRRLILHAAGSRSRVHRSPSVNSLTTATRKLMRRFLRARTRRQGNMNIFPASASVHRIALTLPSFRAALSRFSGSRLRFYVHFVSTTGDAFSISLQLRTTDDSFALIRVYFRCTFHILSGRQVHALVKVSRYVKRASRWTRQISAAHLERLREFI